MNQFVGLIDVGYLRAEGAKAIRKKQSKVRPQANAMISWMREISCPTHTILKWPTREAPEFLRLYWYDGALDPGENGYTEQKRYLDAVESQEGVQLRLGRLIYRPFHKEQAIKHALKNTATNLGLEEDKVLDQLKKDGWSFEQELQQKGVDSLITLDLVKLATITNISTIVLLAGDEDLTEAVRLAQDQGTKVIVATPNYKSLSKGLRNSADQIAKLDSATTTALLTPNKPYPWKHIQSGVQINLNQDHTSQQA